MVQTGFFLGNRDWWVMATLWIDGDEELDKVVESLLPVGCSKESALDVASVLSEPDTGYTYTDYGGRFTLAFVSRGSSMEQFYDTVQHEQKHIVEHISSYFGVDPKSEESAYLQGEVGRLLFPSVAAIICPGYFIR